MPTNKHYSKKHTSQESQVLLWKINTTGLVASSGLFKIATSLSCNSWSLVYCTWSRPSNRKSPVYKRKTVGVKSLQQNQQG